MSEATTNVAAALTAAQEKKAAQGSKPTTSKATAGKSKAGSNLPGARRTQTTNDRPPITFEGAQRLCPSHLVIGKIISVYGLNGVDYEEIRFQTGSAITALSNAVGDCLNDMALRMHMQRIVGAYVGSAYGAGNFYDTKATQARDLTSSVRNDDRDEDRMGIDGQANRAERAREFAAVTAVQAYALLAAAHGALDAYAEIVGEDWKPYVANAAPSRTVSAQATAAQLAAFDR